MELPYTFYSFLYPNRNGGQIKVDVWYYPQDRMTVNILHVDKNSGVSQIFREDIPINDNLVENNRKSIESFIHFLVQENVIILGENVFGQQESTIADAEEVHHQTVGNGMLSFALSVYSLPNEMWKIDVRYGSYLSNVEYVSQGVLIEDVISKAKYPTKEDALYVLKFRFREMALLALGELDEERPSLFLRVN